MEDLILCEETGCCISESVVDNNWLQILAQRKFHWVMMLLLVCNNRLTDRSCILKNGQRKSMKIVKIIFAVCKVWLKFHLTLKKTYQIIVLRNKCFLKFTRRALDFFWNVIVRNGIIEFQNLKLLSARLNKKYVHDTFFHTKYTTPGPVALILKKLFFLLNLFVNVTMIVVQHTRDRGQETLLSWEILPRMDARSVRGPIINYKHFGTFSINSTKKIVKWLNPFA